MPGHLLGEGAVCVGLSFPPFTWMFSYCLDSSSPLPPHSFLIGG